MDLSMLQSEEIIGGIAAILVTIYGVHKKLKSDAVETVNQRAEVNIIEQLIKQRDDALALSDKYHDQVLLNEKEIREIKIKLDTIEIERLKLLEKLDEQESQSAVLKQIIEYLTDTVAITRQSIETSNPETESQEAGN